MTPDDMSLEMLKTLAVMHNVYIKESKDRSLILPQFLEVISKLMSDTRLPAQIWLLRDADKVVGFALSEIVGGYHGLELALSQAYIEPAYRTPETHKLTVDQFETFARNRGCAFIISSTRREPFEVYARWMGRRGFQKRQIVMEKDLRRDK